MDGGDVSLDVVENDPAPEFKPAETAPDFKPAETAPESADRELLRVLSVSVCDIIHISLYCA